MNHKKILAGGGTGLLLAGVLGAGIISAYFTDTEEKINHFTVGSVDIVLEEPEWEKKPDQNQDGIPDEAEDLIPVQTIEKDPQITNTGDNGAYVFSVVQIPCRELITVNGDGTKNPKAMQNLFSYQLNPSWTSLGSCPVKDAEGNTEARKYLYAYAKKGEDCTRLEPGETTAPVFEQITFVNAMEGQGLENEPFEVSVYAYAIQADNLNGDEKTPGQVWSILSNQKELNDSYQ